METTPSPCNIEGEDRQKANRLVQRHKIYHDHRVQKSTTSRPGQWVYVGRTPLAVTAAQRMRTDPYSK